MKCLLACLICVAAMILVPQPREGRSETLTIIRNHETTYSIALAADAIPAEKTAAQQLQKYIAEMTGTQLPILSENDVPAQSNQILVGAGKRAKALLRNQNWNTLGADGIVIKSVGKNLILAGGRPRGTLYAVFQFLEDATGCRWWTPTERLIPKKSTLQVEAQNVVYVPPFSYREHFTTPFRDDAAFATQMRQNGQHQPQTAEWGGHHSILGFVHTFSELLPPKKYFAAHPEWFTDPNNGNLPCTPASKMPADQGTQLDLSNPEVLDELTKQAMALIEKNPDAGYISISQNDNDNYCTCPKCAQIAEAEGSQSGPILHFVNAVAARIGEKYPDFQVETLAYAYSLEPPKTVRPASNVVIRLALNTTDFGHPINSKWNEKSRDNLLAWSKISHSLFVWTYVANFQKTMFHNPTWAGLADDARFFAANKVQGIFAQGDSYTGGVGDFVQLRAWLMGKLLWSPNLDQSQLTDEFLRGYYGAAAPHLRQYLDAMQRAFLAQNRGINTGNADFSYVTLDVANETLGYFEAALQAVKGDEALTYRVRREKLSLDVTILYRYKFLKQEAQRTDKAFNGPAELAPAIEAFRTTAKSYNVQRFSELDGFDAGLDRLALLQETTQVELPAFARNLPAEDVIDIQPTAMTLYQKGIMADVVVDPAASGQTAAMMLGGTVAWSIQAPLGRVLETPNTSWRIYAYARTDAKPGVVWEGNAFDGGLFDDSNMKQVASFNFPWKDAVGTEYHQFDLGVHKLTGGMFVYFAPKNIPAVEKAYVDRVLLVRER